LIFVHIMQYVQLTFCITTVQSNLIIYLSGPSVFFHKLSPDFAWLTSMSYNLSFLIHAFFPHSGHILKHAHTILTYFTAAPQLYNLFLVSLNLWYMNLSATSTAQLSSNFHLSPTKCWYFKLEICVASPALQCRPLVNSNKTHPITDHHSV